MECRVRNTSSASLRSFTDNSLRFFKNFSITRQRILAIHISAILDTTLPVPFRLPTRSSSHNPLPTTTIMAPTPESQISFNTAYRQVIRRRTRSILGLTTSTLLTPLLPYMLIPALIAARSIRKANAARRELATMEAQGYRRRKRDILRGIVHASVERAILLPLTMGHDEVALAGMAVGASYDTSFIVAHEALTHVPVLGDFNELVNIPVDGVQEEVGLEGADQRLDDVAMTGLDYGGWHDGGLDPGSFVAAGATAAVVEYVVDGPFAYQDARDRGAR
jgi:hypothetical protein